MTRSIAAIFTLLMTMFASFSLAQSVDVIEALQVCTVIAARDARLACFDNLGERVFQQASADNEATPEEVAQPEAGSTVATRNAPPPPDDPGMSTFRDERESKSIEYSRKITSCKQGPSGDWYFVFDNGQVWKKVDERDFRVKECNFNVTITKDFFGYKMWIDALERSIRIRRHQ